MTKRRPRVPPAEPYGSINDLPSVKEMKQQFRVLSVFKGLLPREQRQELNRKRREINDLVALVEKFYALLGPRHSASWLAG